MNESAIGTGVGATPDSAVVSSAVDSPSISQGSGAPSGQSSTDVNTLPVQGADQSQTQADPLAGLPTLEELQEQVKQNVPGAKGMAQLRGVYEPLKTQFSELQTKYEPYQSVFERFEQPDQLQEIVTLHDGLVGWKRDVKGQLQPSVTAGAAYAEKYPRHADYLTADLLNMETTSDLSGRRMTRIDAALEALSPQFVGQDSEMRGRRAEALKILGAVEPSSISPQWQPSQEELDWLVADPQNGPTPEELAYQEEYKRVPFEKRQRLKLNEAPDIKEYLDDQKFKRETRERDARTQESAQQQAVQNEQRITRDATAAADQYVQSRLTDALTTFHDSVVAQCNFIQPLDPQNPPQGMTPEQVQAMNAQITESNKAEASMITGLTIALVNDQTRPFVLPLLKQIGVIDDKLLKDMETASDAFGNNARNYGELSYRGKLQANGNGFQPDASMTGLSNEANRSLQRMVHFANQVAKGMMEKRSQFFSMKATDHNQTLNGVAGTRPTGQGSSFDPTTATAPRPTGWQSRDEINRMAGV